MFDSSCVFSTWLCRLFGIRMLELHSTRDFMLGHTVRRDIWLPHVTYLMYTLYTLSKIAFCGQFPLQVFAFASYFERTSSAVGTKPRAVCTNVRRSEKLSLAVVYCLPADSAFYLQVCQWRGGTDAVLCRISVKGKKYNLWNVRETNPKQS